MKEVNEAEAQRLLNLDFKKITGKDFNTFWYCRTTQSTFDFYIRILQHPDTKLREMASFQIARRMTSQFKVPVEPLIDALKDESEKVRQNAASALGGLRNKEAIQPLIKQLKDTLPEVRVKTVIALARFEGTEILEALLSMLNDISGRVRAFTVLGLSHDEHLNSSWLQSKIPQLTFLLTDAASEVRLYAIHFFGKAKYQPAYQIIIFPLKDINSEVRAKAAWALGELGNKGVTEAVAVLLNDLDPQVRLEAGRTLAIFQDQRCIPILTELCSSNLTLNIPSKANEALSLLKNKDETAK